MAHHQNKEKECKKKKGTTANERLDAVFSHCRCATLCLDNAETINVELLFDKSLFKMDFNQF